MSKLLRLAAFAILLGAGCGGGRTGSRGDASAEAAAGSGPAGAGGGAGTSGGSGAGTSGGGAGGDAAGVAGSGGAGMPGAAGSGLAGVGGPPPWGGIESCGGPSPKAPPVCDTMCGNGKRDTCAVPGLGICLPGMFTITEECDGTDMGTSSCATRGYGSGSLSCRADCSIAAACHECMPPSGSLAACRNAPIADPWPAIPSVAATDTVVGLAWGGFEDLDNDKRTLTFARLSTSLELVGTTVLEDSTHSTAPLPLRAILGTAVAPVASGWIVVAAGEPEVFAHAIDAQGKALGRLTIDRVAEGYFSSNFAAVTLTPRPNGGPLVLWGGERSIRASVLAADGKSATAPIELPLDGRFSSFGASAVFVGTSFYVIYSTYNPMPEVETLRLVRVDTDGRATFIADLLQGELTAFPFLAGGANDLRLAYRGTAPGGVPGEDQALLWRRLSLTGATLAGPALVVRPREPWGSGPIVAAGDDTLFLVGGDDARQLGVTRVSLNGTVTAPIQTIAKGPHTMDSYGFVRRGPEAVAAWLAGTIAGPHFNVARVAF